MMTSIEETDFLDILQVNVSENLEKNTFSVLKYIHRDFCKYNNIQFSLLDLLEILATHVQHYAQVIQPTQLGLHFRIRPSINITK